jgi:uncharacterized protein YndB with AHSA1/START domain
MARPTKGEVSIQVDAPPERVYGLVAELTRMGQWSPECYRVDWVGDASGPAVGVEFKGYNRVGPYRWSVGGKVMTAEPGREFAFTTYVGGRESTRWRYRFEPSNTGTAVTESYEFVWARLFVRLSNLVMPRDRILQRGMRETLGRIKTAAEAA